MHVERARGAVGEWTFTDTSVEFEKVDRRALDAWVATAARVAAPLEEARLLLPREVVFFGWDYSGDEPDGRVGVRSAGDIVAASKTFLDDIERQRGFRAPTAIHVLGSGDLVDEEERPRAVEDLVWLNATLLLNPMVTVCAQSDVWMPFDLRGRPHTALYARTQRGSKPRCRRWRRSRSRRPLTTRRRTRASKVPSRQPPRWRRTRRRRCRRRQRCPARRQVSEPYQIFVRRRRDRGGTCRRRRPTESCARTAAPWKKIRCCTLPTLSPKARTRSNDWQRTRRWERSITRCPRE